VLYRQSKIIKLQNEINRLIYEKKPIPIELTNKLMKLRGLTEGGN
jgi:hypothetical protein